MTGRQSESGTVLDQPETTPQGPQLGFELSPHPATADVDDGPDFDLDRALAEGQAYLDEYAALEHVWLMGEPDTDGEGTEMAQESVSYDKWRDLWTRGPAGIREAKALHAADLVDMGEAGEAVRLERANEDIRRREVRPEVTVGGDEHATYEEWQSMLRGSPEERERAILLHKRDRVSRPEGYDGPMGDGPRELPDVSEPVSHEHWKRLFSGTPEDRNRALALYQAGLVQEAGAPRTDLDRPVSREKWMAMWASNPDEAARLHREGLVESH